VVVTAVGFFVVTVFDVEVFVATLVFVAAGVLVATGVLVAMGVWVTAAILVAAVVLVTIDIWVAAAALVAVGAVVATTVLVATAVVSPGTPSLASERETSVGWAVANEGFVCARTSCAVLTGGSACATACAAAEMEVSARMSLLANIAQPLIVRAIELALINILMPFALSVLRLRLGVRMVML